MKEIRMISWTNRRDTRTVVLTQLPLCGHGLEAICWAVWLKSRFKPLRPSRISLIIFSFSNAPPPPPPPTCWAVPVPLVRSCPAFPWISETKFLEKRTNIDMMALILLRRAVSTDKKPICRTNKGRSRPKGSRRVLINHRQTGTNCSLSSPPSLKSSAVSLFLSFFYRIRMHSV